MTLRDKINEYSDENGVIKDKNHMIDGNALLYLGCLAIALNRLGQYLVKDFEAYDKALILSEIKSGLLQRYNKPGDRQTHDDYVGMGGASFFVDSGAFANRVRKYGLSHWFWWMNNKDKPKTFQDLHQGLHVRFFGWWAMIKAASDCWLNPLDEIFASIDLISSGVYEDGSSGVIMSWARYSVFIEKAWFVNPLLRLSCWVFKKLYMKRHPKGIKESFAEFHSPDHPLANLPDGFF